MSPSQKPAILLIPGSFSPAHLYEPVADALRAAGYEARALSLRTVGRPDPVPSNPANMYDDAELIRNAAAALADEGKDVVLVPHSYGGIPATEALKGITKAERQTHGLPGGVVRIIYISCVIVKEGESSSNALKDTPVGELAKPMPDHPAYAYQHDLDTTARIVFSDLPAERAKQLAGQLHPHSAASFVTPLTHPGYRDVPVTYLLCEKDVLLTPAFQRAAIATIEQQAGGKARVDVRTIEAGHCPVLSRPEETAGLIRKAVGEE